MFHIILAWKKLFESCRICKTPNPSQSPNDPPNEARNFAKLKLGKSLIRVFTVSEKTMSILDDPVAVSS